jgi:hypothetical protein
MNGTVRKAMKGKTRSDSRMKLYIKVIAGPTFVYKSETSFFFQRNITRKGCRQQRLNLSME